MTRMLILNGEVNSSAQELRRRLLRFTGSRRATRAILARIEEARSLGRVVGCLIHSVTPDSAREEPSWEVGVTYAGRLDEPRPARG